MCSKMFNSYYALKRLPGSGDRAVNWKTKSVGMELIFMGKDMMIRK